MLQGCLNRAPFRTLLVGVLLACLTGCTSLREWRANGFKVGPNYGRPPAPVAEDWIDADDVRVRTDPGEFARWWQTFKIACRQKRPITSSLIFPLQISMR